ncbi:MAG: tRNA adenylyltransferase [Planctomyces sp.]|nr:tRNA adenylyltransferase [Planctomyces sp.]
MANEKLRRQIVFEAARLMYHRQEKEYYRAKMKAARKICQGWVKPSELPSNAEIRQEIQRFAAIYEADAHDDKLREMRIEALRFLRLLKGFKPRVIGSTLTGHIRKGSDIDIHVFASSTSSVTMALDQEGLEFTVEQKQVRKHGEENTYVHIHVQERYPVELTVYPSDKAHYVFKSSITGKAMERASLAEFEQFLEKEYPKLELDEAVEGAEDRLDRFQVYASLLFPLGQVKHSRKYHPEGDALYHSLQVYDLMCDEVPYDEEMLLAALLHDVGKAIDPGDHVGAALHALDGFITPRTAWLIEHHMESHKLVEGTLGARARRRLQESEYYEDLILLGECDRGGREEGVEVPEVEDALDYIRSLV